MKKAIGFLIILLTLIFLTAPVVYAAETSDKEYLVTEVDGVYRLSYYLDGTPQPLGEAANLTELLGELSGGTVTFDAVSTEGFELPSGSYCISGSVYLFGSQPITVPDGAHLSLDKLTVRVNDGDSAFIRIKGGSIHMTDSYVYGSSGGAFLLDYSTATELILTSCGIYSDSEVATVRIENGSFAIRGGEISNTKAEAIANDGILFLSDSPEISGIGYDVVTENPITLGYNGVPYSTESLDVRYLTQFSRGELTEVFYSTSADTVSHINLYDENGKAVSTTYFDSYKNHAEKSFAAVYLPYVVKYFDRGELVSEDYYLRGERLATDKPSAREGYSFLGWCSDTDGNTPVTDGESVSQDMTLYAIYRLLPPTVSASSLHFVYDGRERTLKVGSTSHALDSKGGFYTYRWYKGGEFISSDSALAIREVSDSGSYRCEVTLNYATDSVTVTVDPIVVNVEKCRVPPPIIDPVCYTGELVIPTIFDNEIYTVFTEGGINVGRYGVTLTLCDSDNYCWENSENTSVEIPFEIIAAQNLWLDEISIYDVYFGAEPTPLAISKFGTPAYFYSDKADGDYSTAVPSAVGKYYVIASVDGTANYLPIVSAPISFEILAEEVVGLTVSTPPDISDYRAFDKFVPTSLVLTARYNSGREAQITALEISVSYQSGDSFSYGDNAVILSFGGCSIPYRVNVSKAEYDISGIEFDDLTVIYNGLYHTPAAPTIDIVGLDGKPLILTVSGGGKDVGAYNVTLSFSTDSLSYSLPESMYATLTVTPMTATVLWQNTEFTYDGKPHAPTAFFTDALGINRELSVSGSAVQAGSKYTAIATLSDSNYTLTDYECSFDIFKANYDFSGTHWSSDSFVYDGQPKQVYLIDLPYGVEVSGYVDGEATNAGSYTAIAVLSYDERNYNRPPTQSHNWTVARAEYDTSIFSFPDVSYVYDGEAHYPALRGEMPLGHDGSMLQYEFSGGATHVDDGIVAITVSFYSDSSNYTVPDAIVSHVTITPKSIVAHWSIGDYVYNGLPQSPTAISEECPLVVSGAATDAGTYTAIASCTSTDFTLTNSTADFCIRQAHNAWTAPPEILDFYESALPAPASAAVYGIAVYEYFTDAECTDEAAFPLIPGKYYMIATVPESTNYLPLTSEPLSFEVIEVIAVGISAELTKQYFVAFDTISENDISATLIFNDGTVIPLHYTEIEIIYERADSLRAADTVVRIIYDSFSVNAPIEVIKADYDLSETVWQCTDAIYDGVAKSPVLSGLPSGITVFQYIGGEQTNAGTYTVTASLGYDAENYTPPIIPACIFTIAKAALPIPTLLAVEYMSETVVPTIDTSLYTFVDLPDMIDAGSYRLTLSLIDSRNYCFEDGASDCTIDFSILPRRIAITVDDMDVYLWDEPGEAIYTVPDGAILDGDSVTFLQHIEDDRIYLYSANPNYVLDGAVGNINRLSVPNPHTMEIIATVAVVLLLLILLAAVLILNRKRIFAYHPKPITASSANNDTVLESNDIALKSNDTTLKSNDTIKTEEASNPLTESCEPTVEESDMGYIDNTETEDISSDSFEEEIKQDLSENDDNEDDADWEESGNEPNTLRVNEENAPTIAIDIEKADSLITDSLAKDLVKKNREAIITAGNAKGIINVDTLSNNFLSGDRVDVNVLKNKRLIPYDTAYIKVLARGMIDKPLRIYANDFSLSAVKMIALTGGEAIKVTTVKQRPDKS